MDVTDFEQLRVVFENAAKQLTTSGGKKNDVYSAAMAIDKISKVRAEFDGIDPRLRFAIRLAFEKVPPIGTKKKRLPTESSAYNQLRCLRNKLFANELDEPTRIYTNEALTAMAEQLSAEAMDAVAARVIAA